MGSAVTWLYEVTNTGNVKLTDIAVSDDKLGSVGATPSLDPGESVTFTASGTAIRSRSTREPRYRDRRSACRILRL